MGKKKAYAIFTSAALLFALAAIFLLVFMNLTAKMPKAEELPVLAEIEIETQRSTFLEAEILAWEKQKPAPAETAAPEAPENPAGRPPAETQALSMEPEPEPEELTLKKFVSLASDPPPEPETLPPEPEPEPEPDPEPEPEAEPELEPEPEPEGPEPTEAPPPPPPPAVHDDTAEKFLVISFDDGPGPHTERLLDILAANGAKATFFIVGYKIPSYKETIKRMAEQGHQVAGHSWNHPYFTKSSNEKIRWELQCTNDAIYEVTGITPKFYRVPYGAYNDNIKNISKEMGLSLIQWNIDVSDWKVRNANTVYSNVMSMAKDGGIICMHDVHPTTVDAMERAIPDLIAAGYKLVTVSELLGDMEPGRVYYNRGYSK